MRVASVFCILLLSLLSTVYCRPVPGGLRIVAPVDKRKAVPVPRERVAELRQAKKEAKAEYKRLSKDPAQKEHAAAARKNLGALKAESSYHAGKMEVPHERVAALRKANKEANSQYKHMQRVLADPSKPEHAAVIHKAFGHNPDLKAIRNNVDTMKSKTSFVKNLESKTPGVLAFSRTTSDGQKHLHFTSHYFNDMTPLGRAGTLIHEASHHLVDTKDKFAKTSAGPHSYHPISQRDARDLPKDSVKSGYLHGDFETIKNSSPNIMHHNADSYKTFGHHAKYGADTPMDHMKA